MKKIAGNRADRYLNIKKNLHESAVQDEDIRAIIAIGSFSRKETPADEYSDLDLIIVTKKPETWFSGEYPKMLGKVRISFIEPTLGGGMERRCIYDEDQDVDMIILTPDQFEKALMDGVAGWVMSRGYSVLYDADCFSELAKEYVSSAVTQPEMTEEEFTNLVNDFFFHNIWACKKLQRGELWSAKMCIDAYLKNLLIKMIEQYQIVSNESDVWHDGRFLDWWAAPSILDDLKDCFAHYDEKDCRKALLATHDLFSTLASSVAERKEYVFPAEAKKCAAEYLNQACQDGEYLEANIEIKLADRSNFTEFSMDSFDRFQEVRNVYRIENGKLVLKNNPFTETWSPERKREKASEILSGQYITYCAFDGNTVVGEIMLMPELNEHRMIIDSFHVSRDYRRHGIGRQMIETVTDYAKSRGAEALYASCCSAEETIAFYMAMGFRPSAHPIPSCVRDEPFDIQMEFPIGICADGNYGQKGSKVCKGDNFLANYADDFIAGFQYIWEAEEYYQLLKARMEKFGLELEESKSHMVMMGRYIANARVKSGENTKFGTFDFLGFSFYCGKSKTGKPWIMPKTSGKKFRKKVKAMKEWLYRHRDTPLKLIMKTVNMKLVGHYRYYGVSFNSRWIANFWFQTRELLFKILNRRSNRRSYTRAEFVDMLKYYPLATPKVYVSLFQ